MRTINWREHEASTEGTQALWYLVHTLQEAQMNLSLQLTVQALMQSNNLLPPSNEEAPNQVCTSSPKSACVLRESEQDESSLEVAPRKQCIPRSPNHSSRRAHKPSNNLEMYSRDGKGDRGRHLQKRRRHPSPPSSSPYSYDLEELDSSMGSSQKVHSSCKCKGTYHAWRRARELEKFKGGKNITFLSYNGAYGKIDKVLVFVQ